MWNCKQCGWAGSAPSESDASDVRVDAEGNLVIDRVHILVCPECFHAVRRIESTSTFFDFSLEGSL